MPYSPMLIKPMRDEVTEVGIQELQTTDDVEKVLNNDKGTTLLFINSVCGCAAGMARPALRKLKEDKGLKGPDRWVSVFAGQDLEATARARSYFPDIPPSSPSIAFFKDGELVYFVPKFRIENRDADSVAADLKAAFEEFV
jgi:putative YphP/YqiW family bacilliredoxin